MPLKNVYLLFANLRCIRLFVVSGDRLTGIISRSILFQVRVCLRFCLCFACSCLPVRSRACLLVLACVFPVLHLSRHPSYALSMFHVIHLRVVLLRSTLFAFRVIHISRIPHSTLSIFHVVHLPHFPSTFPIFHVFRVINLPCYPSFTLSMFHFFHALTFSIFHVIHLSQRVYPSYTFFHDSILFSRSFVISVFKFHASSVVVRDYPRYTFSIYHDTLIHVPRLSTIPYYLVFVILYFTLSRLASVALHVCLCSTFSVFHVINSNCCPSSTMSIFHVTYLPTPGDV